MKRISHHFVVDVFLFNCIFNQITLNYTLINSKKYNTRNMVFSYSIIKPFIKFRKLENFCFSCVGLFPKFCLNLYFFQRKLFMVSGKPWIFLLKLLIILLFYVTGISNFSWVFRNNIKIHTIREMAKLNIYLRSTL